MAFTLDLIKPGEGAATRYMLEDGTYLIGRGTSCTDQLSRILKSLSCCYNSHDCNFAHCAGSFPCKILRQHKIFYSCI